MGRGGEREERREREGREEGRDRGERWEERGRGGEEQIGVETVLYRIHYQQ